MNEIKHEISNIFGSLMGKTATGMAIWRSKDNVATIELPRFAISVGKDDSGEKPAYFARITWSDGREAAYATVDEGDPYYVSFRRMHEQAYGASVKSIAAEIRELVSGLDTLGLPPPPPGLPSSPSAAQRHHLFRKIAANWTLTWGPQNRSEDVTINEEGKYFVTRDGVTTVKPVFELQLLECNADCTKVEWAKFSPEKARTTQIEVLEISADEMTGFAKHDRHPLTYRRKPSV